MSIEQKINDETLELRGAFDEGQTIMERKDFIPAILNAYDYAAKIAAKSASLAVTKENGDALKNRAIFDEAVCRGIESVLEFLRRYDDSDSYDTDYSLEMIEHPKF